MALIPRQSVANDYEQSVGRVFAAIKRIVECSPQLRAEAKITTDKITVGDAVIIAIPSNYASAAGSNQVVAIFDELWAYGSERLRRLFDELVPPPTRRIACRLTVTYAGFEGEGHLLQDLYKRGMQLPEVGTDLRAGDGMLMFWSHTPICHWQDEKWLAQMRRDLPANQFCGWPRIGSPAPRLRSSTWRSGTIGVDINLGHGVSNPMLPIFIGIDASHKHDQTAIVATTFDRKAQQVRLIFHRSLQPSASQPLDFEQTIEKTVLDLSRRFLVRQVLFDPWQMQATAQRLAAAAVKIEEFPQSPSNLTTASQNLFDLIEGGKISSLIPTPPCGSRSVASSQKRRRAAGGSRSKTSAQNRCSNRARPGRARTVQGQTESSFDTSYRWVGDDAGLAGIAYSLRAKWRNVHSLKPPIERSAISSAAKTLFGW